MSSNRINIQWIKSGFELTIFKIHVFLSYYRQFYTNSRIKTSILDVSCGHQNKNVYLKYVVVDR